MSAFDKLSPAVKKETKNVIIGTAVCVLVMLALFLILHIILPEQVPFDFTVLLGGLCGYAIAVINFFLMAVTVQKVASMEDRDAATKLMRTSYSRRLLLQCLWIIVVVFAPCFQLFAGILPILFPSLAIKVYGIFRKDLKSEMAAASGSAAVSDSDAVPDAADITDSAAADASDTGSDTESKA